MAASPVQPADLQLVDLREISAAAIEPILAEQSAHWRDHFRWDFAPARDIILRYVRMRNLYGYALFSCDSPVGYSYFIHEANKALLGESFVSASHRSEPAERHLLTQTLRAAAVFPGVRRIEGQLLALGFDPAGDSIYGRKLAVYARNFMLADDLDAISSVPEDGASFEFRQWTDRDLEPAAELIRRAYDGHVDSFINDQYRTSTGARRFLYNSTQHPGCGIFFRQGARAAFDRLTGEMAGLCLGSLVQSRVAHVTQLCVGPNYRGRGLGRQLLSRASKEYRRHGCNAASLTVTASNEGAIRLYKSMGFRTIHRFPAIVWEAY